MTHFPNSQPNSTLTEEEWKELVALKKQINQNPAAVHQKKWSYLLNYWYVHGTQSVIPLTRKFGELDIQWMNSVDKHFRISYNSEEIWKGGRVVEGSSLEN